MRSLRITLTVTSIIIIFLCSGLVSALNSDEASVSTVLLNQTVHPSDTLSVIITFSSNSADQLSINRIGLHFDWMAPNEFYTNDLTANPVSVESNGSHVFEAMAIQIPPYVSAGSHSYYVGIDGVQGLSGTFSWDSAASTIQVYAATGSSPTPTATSSPSSGGGQEEGPSLLLYLAVIAVVVIVALSIIVVVMRKRRKRAVSIAD